MTFSPDRGRAPAGPNGPGLSGPYRRAPTTGMMAKPFPPHPAMNLLLLTFAASLAVLLFAVVLWLAVTFGPTLIPKRVNTSEDLPWIAPGRQAKAFVVTRDGIMSPTGRTRRVEWGRSRTEHRSPHEVAYAAMAALDAAGGMKDWPPFADPESPAAAPHPVCDAPYALHLVSLYPTVLLLRPAPDYPAWRRRRDAGLEPSTEPPAQSVTVPRITNPIEYGTRLPYTPELLWYCPKSGARPAPVEMIDEEHALVPLPYAPLLLVREDDSWVVSRE